MNEYDYYNVFLLKEDLVQMKIVIQNIEILSNLLNDADPDIYDKYVVFGHFFCVEDKRLLCTGTISQPAKRRVYK